MRKSFELHFYLNFKQLLYLAGYLNQLLYLVTNGSTFASLTLSSSNKTDLGKLSSLPETKKLLKLNNLGNLYKSFFLSFTICVAKQQETFEEGSPMISQHIWPNWKRKDFLLNANYVGRSKSRKSPQNCVIKGGDWDWVKIEVLTKFPIFSLIHSPLVASELYFFGQLWLNISWYRVKHIRI